MANVGSQRVELRIEEPAGRPAGIPARLRSLFSVPTWSRKPQPRVRYGQPFLPGLGALSGQAAAEFRGVLERAEAVAARRFTYLGRTVAFSGPIDWEPPGTSERWRIALNSLEDLEAIGVAAAVAPAVDGRRRWYDCAIGLVREWTAGGRGAVAARLPALARRVPSLLHAHVFFAPELRADPRLRRGLLESLYAQAAALARTVASHPHDHDLITAGRALFMAGRFFDGMEARGWLDQGEAILWGELRQQVHDDGGHRARDLAVHLGVLADYLEVMAFLRAANDDIPVWARKRVKGMADLVARLLHPDGEIPLFHQAAAGAARPASEVLTAAAVVLHEPGLAPPGDLPGVWPLLVIGEWGRRAHAHLARRKTAGEGRALRRTGFYVLPGEPGDLMLLDGGSPPPGGDASAFGYELSVGGERLVVDAGCATEDGGEWAEYFRSTRAHNAVCVDGADQITGGRAPAVSDVHWTVRDGLLYFTGTHDGFARLSLDLRLQQRRHVFCLPGRFWVVCDEVLGSGEHEAESFVHFHPDVVLTANCQGRPTFVAARGPAARLLLVPAHAPEVHVQRGVDEPPRQGWYAPRPGERRAASAVSLIARGRLPLALGYALLPRAAQPATLSLERDAFRLHARLRVGGDEYLLTVVQGDVELRVRRASV